MKKILVTFIFLSTLFPSCKKDDIKIDPNNLLIGIWNYSGYHNNIDTYARCKEFTSTYCYKFNTDGSLTERYLAGFCATPPLSLADYQGTWTILNDSLIKIDVASWSGTRTYKLNIVSLSTDSLKIITRYDK
jgi:hypothetical protein